MLIEHTDKLMESTGAAWLQSYGVIYLLFLILSAGWLAVHVLALNPARDEVVRSYCMVKKEHAIILMAVDMHSMTYAGAALMDGGCCFMVGLSLSVVLQTSDSTGSML